MCQNYISLQVKPFFCSFKCRLEVMAIRKNEIYFPLQLFSRHLKLLVQNK